MVGISAGQRYRTSSPVTARPISIRWISLVPSKIVKILAIGAVFAGQRPAYPRGISTDSARPVRDEFRFWTGPCAIWRRGADALQSADEGGQEVGGRPRRHSVRGPHVAPVHPRYISALSCTYTPSSACRPSGRRARGRAAPGRAAPNAADPGLPAVGRHGGAMGRTGRWGPAFRPLRYVPGTTWVQLSPWRVGCWPRPSMRASAVSSTRSPFGSRPNIRVGRFRAADLDG